jgi:hypothetical protein
VDAAQLPWTTLGSTNAALIIMAQNLSWFPRGDSHEALALLRSVLHNGYYTSEVQSAGSAEVSIGGRTFARDSFRLKKRGVPMTERVYARIENNYVLEFLLIAPGDEELDRLEKTLATIHFN